MTEKLSVDYTLTHVVTSSASYIENDNLNNGDFTQSGTESFTTTNLQSSDSGGIAALYTETFAQNDSLTVSGNDDTGTVNDCPDLGDGSHTLTDVAGDAKA